MLELILKLSFHDHNLDVTAQIMLSHKRDQNQKRSFSLHVSYHEKSLSNVSSVELLLHLPSQVV